MLTEVRHQDEGVRFLRRFVEGRLVSPVLLIGDEGVGRRFSVMKAIQEAFCLADRQPGCQCYSCLVLPQGLHPDVTLLYPEGESSIGVDEVRDVVAQAKDYPTVGAYRCFVIDGADRFTPPAANAFLKTLEEPPARSRFFLLSEFSDQVLPTIRSRCGRIQYGQLPEEFVLSVLHQYETDDAKALVYTRMGEGSIGRAIRYWGSGRLGLRDLVVKVLQLALDRDLPSLFASVDKMEQDLVQALKFLEQLLHDVLIARVDPMRVIHADKTDEILDMAKRAGLPAWVKLSGKVRALQSQYRSTKLNLSFHVKTILVESFI